MHNTGDVINNSSILKSLNNISGFSDLDDFVDRITQKLHDLGSHNSSSSNKYIYNVMSNYTVSLKFTNNSIGDDNNSGKDFKIQNITYSNGYGSIVVTSTSILFIGRGAGAGFKHECLYTYDGWNKIESL